MSPAATGTLTPLRVTNLETGEQMDLSVGCSTEDAYHRLANLRAFQKAMAQIGDAWEQQIAVDMQERQAQQRWVDGVLYEYKTGQEWVVDPDRMIPALQALVDASELPPSEFEKAVTYPPVVAKVNNAVLNQLMKLGGRVAAAIESNRIQMPTAAKLTIKRQAQP